MDKIDLFAIKFEFNFKSKLYYSTGFSQILSFIFILMFLLTFIWNFVYMVKRNQLSINSYRTDISSEDKILFNEGNSFLGFSLYDENFKYIPENTSYLKYFRSQAFFVISNETDFEEYELTIRNCNETLNRNFLNVKSNTIKSCIDFNNSLIQGNFYSFSTSYFSLRVDFNQNAYRNETKSQDSFICYIIIFFPISSINLNNFEKPYNTSIGYNYYTLSLNQSKTNFISYSIEEIHTDGNFIGSTDRIDKTISSKYKFDPHDNHQNIIFDLILYIDPIKTIYYRYYMNFQHVLNNVNSIMCILSIIFKFLSSYFNKIKLRQNFIEEDMLFKKESNFDLFDVNINSIKREFTAVEENKAHKQDSARNNLRELDIKPHTSNVVSSKEFIKPKISDDLPFIIKLLYCKCRKKSSFLSNYALIKVYEFYESIIDVKNILINLHKLNNFRNKIANISNTNSNNEKIVIKLIKKKEKSDQIVNFFTH